MKIEHKVFSALAIATAAVTIGAAAVSAAPLGDSGENIIDFSAEAGLPVSISAEIDSNSYPAKDTITVDFPADMLPEGDYRLKARSVLDSSIEKSFLELDNSGLSIVSYQAVDIELYTADGVAIHDVKPVLTLNTAEETGYNAILVFEGDKLVYVAKGDDVVVDGKTVSAEVPHLSRFVFAYIAREESDAPVEESSKPEDVSNPVDDNSSTGSESEASNDVRPNRDDKDGYKTGENSNATAIVFAVMSAVALGIALAASKTKKSAE